MDGLGRLFGAKLAVTGLAAFADLSKLRFDADKIAALSGADQFGGLGFKIL